MNLLVGIIKKLSVFIQYPLPHDMTKSGSFGVIKKPIQEVTNCFTGLTEEFLPVITIGFVSSDRIVIFGHELFSFKSCDHSTWSCLDHWFTLPESFLVINKFNKKNWYESKLSDYLTTGVTLVG